MLEAGKASLRASQEATRDRQNAEVARKHRGAETQEKRLAAQAKDDRLANPSRYPVASTQSVLGSEPRIWYISFAFQIPSAWIVAALFNFSERRLTG